MVTKTFLFKAPALIVSGVGAAREAGNQAFGLGKKALIVTDRTVVGLGLLEEITGSLKEKGIPWEVYDEVNEEPTVEHVEKGLVFLRKTEADLLVAVGGGSPLDAAKAIAAVATNPGRISDFAGAGKVQNPSLPLIAIPTTSGTGSEVTQFTIITDPDREVKMLIASPNLMPKAALVDPLLTLSMPQGITAATGIDALTHAIEAYVSIKAQPLTDTLALEAIRLISANLRPAWANGDNIEARINMATGALLAGLAFSNSSVALIHGMARPLGAYFHVPHGLSNAMLLPQVMEFSVPGNPRRYRDIARAMGEQTDDLSVLDAAYLSCESLFDLTCDLKIPTLKEWGVEEDRFNGVIDKMASDALASGSPANNPRKAAREEIVELYRIVFS